MLAFLVSVMKYASFCFRLNDAIQLVNQFKSTNPDFAQAADENNFTDTDLLTVRQALY